MKYYCSGSSFYLTLHRIDPGDTGQSGVVWKGTVSVPGEAYLLLAYTYLYIGATLVTTSTGPFKQTMGYLLVASTYVPLIVIGASCWICYFNQPWIWMTSGCVITHKYSHHVTLLGYMGVGFVWDNWFFDYRMTNKLIFIHQTLIQPCVPTANDEIPWDAGHWILHNNFSTPYSGSQLTSSKRP